MRKLLHVKLREIKGVNSRLAAFGILFSLLQITQAGVSMEASMNQVRTEVKAENDFNSESCNERITYSFPAQSFTLLKGKIK